MHEIDQEIHQRNLEKIEDSIALGEAALLKAEVDKAERARQFEDERLARVDKILDQLCAMIGRYFREYVSCTNYEPSDDVFKNFYIIRIPEASPVRFYGGDINNTDGDLLNPNRMYVVTDSNGGVDRISPRAASLDVALALARRDYKERHPPHDESQEPVYQDIEQPSPPSFEQQIRDICRDEIEKRA
jgi:hypothetical protein